MGAKRKQKKIKKRRKRKPKLCLNEVIEKKLRSVLSPIENLEVAVMPCPVLINEGSSKEDLAYGVYFINKKTQKQLIRKLLYYSVTKFLKK